MASKKETITVTKYAELAGVTTPAISYRITKGLILPGVKNYTFDKLTRQYQLVLDKRVQAEEIKNYFRTTKKG